MAIRQNNLYKKTPEIVTRVRDAAWIYLLKYENMIPSQVRRQIADAVANIALEESAKIPK